VNDDSLKNGNRDTAAGVVDSSLLSLAIFVLLLNITCAIVAAAAGNPQRGIATAYTSDCKVASRWTTGLNLLINVLSSLLLGASSYCMQRLVAPTRREIDKAHAKGKWLDVGVLSLRNLSYIHKNRLILWILLALSSIPLHFLYVKTTPQLYAIRTLKLG